MIKDTPALFDKSTRAKKILTIEELCVAHFFRSQKTLNDICAKYQFKDIEDLQRFCNNVLYVVRDMNAQQDAMTSLCNSNIVERLIKQGTITVKPKDR